MNCKTEKKKILSFDLDMTLVDDKDNKIPRSAIDAINQVRNDYYIVIATGRNLELAANQYVLEELKPDAWVHNNGAQVHIEGKQVYYHEFNKDLLKRLLDFSISRGLCVCAMINNVEYCTIPEDLKAIQYILSGDARPEYDDVMKLLELPVQTLGFVGKDEKAQILRDAFPELKIPSVIPNIWCDIMEKNISKVVGMEKVLSHYQLTMKDVIAFGDSMNDYEILKAAGYAVAMGNAADGLKEIADYITDDVDKDGIANALRMLCRKNSL